MLTPTEQIGTESEYSTQEENLAEFAPPAEVQVVQEERDRIDKVLNPPVVEIPRGVFGCLLTLAKSGLTPEKIMKMFGNEYYFRCELHCGDSVFLKPRPGRDLADDRFLPRTLGVLRNSHHVGISFWD